MFESRGITGTRDRTASPTGRRFVARVGSSLSFTAAYGGGAAEVLLDAIARSNGTRSSVARELFHTRIRDGILGALGIDSHGDPLTAPVSVFRMRDGAHNATGVSDDQGAVLDRVIEPPSRIVAYAR